MFSIPTACCTSVNSVRPPTPPHPAPRGAPGFITDRASSQGPQVAFNLAHITQTSVPVLQTGTGGGEEAGQSIPLPPIVSEGATNLACSIAEVPRWTTYPRLKYHRTWARYRQQSGQGRTARSSAEQDTGRTFSSRQQELATLGNFSGTTPTAAN